MMSLCVVFLYSYDQGGYTKITSLFVSDLHQDDFGKYVCVAENSLGTGSAEVHLYGTSPLHRVCITLSMMLVAFSFVCVRIVYMCECCIYSHPPL